MNAKKLVAARINSAVVDLDFAKKKSAGGDKSETEKLKKAHDIKKNALKDTIDALNDKMSSLETNDALKAVGQSVRIKAKTEAAKKLLKAADAEETKELKIKIKGWQEDEANIIKDYESTTGEESPKKEAPKDKAEAATKAKEKTASTKAKIKDAEVKADKEDSKSDKKEAKKDPEQSDEDKAQQIKDEEADLKVIDKNISALQGQVDNDEGIKKGGVAPTRLAGINSRIEKAKSELKQQQSNRKETIANLRKLGVDIDDEGVTADAKKRDADFKADVAKRDAEEKAKSKAKSSEDENGKEEKISAAIDKAEAKLNSGESGTGKELAPEFKKKWQEYLAAKKSELEVLKGSESNLLEALELEIAQAVIELDRQLTEAQTVQHMSEPQETLVEKIASIKSQLETNADFNRTNEARQEVERRIRQWEQTVSQMNELNSSSIESAITIDMAQLEKDIFALNSKKPDVQQSETVKLAMQEAAALGGAQKDPAAVADENVAKLDKTRALMKAAGLI